MCSWEDAGNASERSKLGEFECDVGDGDLSKEFENQKAVDNKNLLFQVLREKELNKSKS